MDQLELNGSVGLEARCVRCSVMRLAPRESTVVIMASDEDAESVASTIIVSTVKPCDCGEHRVKIRAELDLF